MNEPMALMLRTLALLGGRASIAGLFNALPAAPAWVNRTYLDDLALMGRVVVRDNTVWLSRVPASSGGARPG